MHEGEIDVKEYNLEVTETNNNKFTQNCFLVTILHDMLYTALVSEIQTAMFASISTKLCCLHLMRYAMKTKVLLFFNQFNLIFFNQFNM